MDGLVAFQVKKEKNVPCVFGRTVPLKQIPCRADTQTEVSELPTAHVSLSFNCLPLDGWTIITASDYGCDSTPLSIPGSCAPGLPPADQKVSGGVRPAMPYHDGAGL